MRLHWITLLPLIILLASCRDRAGEGSTEGETHAETLRDVRIEFYIASDSSRPGFVEQQVRADARSLFVQPDPFLTRDHIASADVAESDLGRGLRLHLTEGGRRLLHETTAMNVGRVLAISIDGEVVSAPQIREEMNTPTVLVTGSLSGEEIDWIASLISGQARRDAPR